MDIVLLQEQFCIFIAYNIAVCRCEIGVEHKTPGTWAGLDLRYRLNRLSVLRKCRTLFRNRGLSIERSLLSGSQWRLLCCRKRSCISIGDNIATGCCEVEAKHEDPGHCIEPDLPYGRNCSETLWKYTIPIANLARFRERLACSLAWRKPEMKRFE